MLMSKQARTRFDLLLEASASHAARHYSAELQEKHEVVVSEAARDFVDQVTRDEYEATEGAYDPPAGEEAPF